MSETRRTLRAELLPRRVGQAALLGVVIIGGIGSYRLGTNVDAKVITDFTQANLRVLSGGTSAVDYAAATPDVIASYGYTVQTSAHLVLRVLTWITGGAFDPYSARAYAFRNLVVYVVSLLAYVGVYASAKALRESRKAGWLAVMFLALLPSFVGNALFNEKDVPLAAGIAMLAAAYASVSTRHIDAGDRSRAWFTPVITAGGLILSVGSRPGIWPIACVIVGAVAFWAFRDGQLRRHALSIAVAGVILVGTNGYLLHRPMWWLSNAISVSTKFPSGVPVAVRGDFLPPTTKWFGPYILFLQTPVFVLLAAGAFAVGSVGLLVRSMSKRFTEFRKVSAYGLIVGLAFGPVAIGSIGGSALYDAARQYLFVFPLLAIMAAVAVDWLFCRTRSSWMRRGLVAFLVISLVHPTISLAQLFPYAHVYGNEVSQAWSQPSDNWFDNQGVSAKEAQIWINKNLPTRNEAAIYPQNFSPYSPKNRFVDPSDPAMTVYTQVFRPTLLPDYFGHCPLVFEVSRKIFGQKRLLSYVRLCGRIPKRLRDDVRRLNPVPSPETPTG